MIWRRARLMCAIAGVSAAFRVDSQCAVFSTLRGLGLGLFRNNMWRSAEWRALDALIRFWICAIAAWSLLLALELRVERPGPAELWNRAQYAISLAGRYSVWCVLPLWAAHALRWCWLRAGLRADLRMTTLVAALLIPASYRQADLLTSGGLMLESRLRELGLWLIFGGLWLANLLLWHLHLVLCGATGHPIGSALRRRLREPASPTRRRVYIALATLGFALGFGALWLFSDVAPRKLRAYLFFSQFVLPSAFVLAASLLYALQRRAGARVLGPIALALLGVCLAARVHPIGMHRAKAFFERRGALIALTELSSTSAPSTSYANIDVSDPSRFHCATQLTAAAPSKPPPPSPDHRHVILISVDTLRKDALAMTMPGDGTPVAPNLRAIAAKSLQFERAVTTYPATLFAVSSALTGQSPSEVMFAPRPPDNLFTLTRGLFQETLIALPSANWFQQRPVPQLFTQNVRPGYFADAEHATQHVVARLREARSRKRRTFAWVHYYEPHGSRPTGRLGTSAVDNARRSYGSLVHTVDSQIGVLWRELERLGYLRDSLVIVFSDHGEALGELDYFGHHVYLNQFATDIPLLVHAPGVEPRQVTQLALLSDIAQTVLAWLGLPPVGTDARDLLTLSDQHEARYGVSEAFPVRGRALYNVARSPITDSTTLAERIALTRTAAIDYQPKVALTSAQHRLIVNRVTGVTELYDRVADPAEKRDLSASPLPEHTHMQEVLRARMRELSERIYCRVQDALSGTPPAGQPGQTGQHRRPPRDPRGRLQPL